MPTKARYHQQLRCAGTWNRDPKQLHHHSTKHLQGIDSSIAEIARHKKPLQDRKNPWKSSPTTKVHPGWRFQHTPPTVAIKNPQSKTKWRHDNHHWQWRPLGTQRTRYVLMQLPNWQWQISAIPDTCDPGNRRVVYKLGCLQEPNYRVRPWSYIFWNHLPLPERPPRTRQQKTKLDKSQITIIPHTHLDFLLWKCRRMATTPQHTNRSQPKQGSKPPPKWNRGSCHSNHTKNQTICPFKPW